MFKFLNNPGPETTVGLEDLGDSTSLTRISERANNLSPKLFLGPATHKPGPHHQELVASSLTSLGSQ